MIIHQFFIPGIAHSSYIIAGNRTCAVIDPSRDIGRYIDTAREIASCEDPIPVGILYHNPAVPCYEDLRHAGAPRSPELTRAGLDAELDKYTIWPEQDMAPARAD